MSAVIDRLDVGGLTWEVRRGTSDEKSIREVVERREYGRHGFTPGEGEHWIDLGANVGAFSVLAGSLGAQVTAYEPDPESVDMLMRNLSVNGLHDMVEVVSAAVVVDGRVRSVTLNQNTANGNVWRNSIERTWRGGKSIEVPTVGISKVWNDKAWVKMDIEGTEMPILEWCVDNNRRATGMVFEWSFDVDPSITRFKRVTEGLRGLYEHMSSTKMPDGYDTWQPSWFPPCRKVFCW